MESKCCDETLHMGGMNLKMLEDTFLLGVAHRLNLVHASVSYQMLVNFFSSSVT